MRREAIIKVTKYMSLNRALEYCGISKQTWYYTAHPRNIPNRCRRHPNCQVHCGQAPHVRHTTHSRPDSAGDWDSNKPQAGAMNIPQIRLHSATKEEK